MSEESASETKQRMANKIATPKNKILFGKILSAISIDKTKSEQKKVKVKKNKSVNITIPD